MALTLNSHRKEQLLRLPASFYGGWRISLRPWILSSQEREQLERLGPILYQFYRVCNLLYQQSLRGIVPSWIAEYLDVGKEDEILSIGRMKRFRNVGPCVIRPDLIQTKDGFLVCEFDLNPGGIGLMAQFQESYGGEEMLNGFAQMLQQEAGAAGENPHTAIVITEEAIEYRPELEALAQRLARIGLPARVLTPSQLEYRQEEVFYAGRRLDLIYRFFELYEFEGIPHGRLLLKAIKQRRIKIIPGIRPHLEEKSWFALFHHPALRSFWKDHLGQANDRFLQTLIPRTWILDPRPGSPSTVIPGIEFRGNGVQDWRVFSFATQKERSRWVIKPSGYSRMAWGAKGVRVGEDLSSRDWNQALEEGLASFTRGPWLLQEWGHPARRRFSSVSPEGKEEETEVRARISPFYFVIGGQVQLGGVLATLCPLDKKIIHGMPGAILAPAT